MRSWWYSPGSTVEQVVGPPIAGDRDRDPIGTGEGDLPDVHHRTGDVVGRRVGQGDGQVHVE
jgi:hypothetical protein